MAIKALVGVNKIEYGTVVGDGTMPVTMTAEFGLIVPDSVVLTFEEPERTDIYVEEQDTPYISIPNPERVKSLLWRSRDMEPDQLELVFGGSVATTVWSAPVSEVAIFYAIKVTSKTFDTTLFVVDIPKALVLASLDAKMYKTDTSEIAVRADVQAVDDAGTPKSPIQITKTN